MDIRYRDEKIRDLCEKRRLAKKQLGANSARKLILRLQQLEAAANVTDLIAGNPHPLTGDRAAEFAVALAGGHRLVFAPANDPCPMNNLDSSIDWKRVTIVRIEYIGDYHD